MGLYNLIPYRKISYCEFTLNNADINERIKELRDGIEDIGLSREQKVKLPLQMETILLNWQSSMGPDTTVSAKLYTIFNRYYLRLGVNGTKHNPLLDTTPYGVPSDFIKIISDIESDWDISPVYDYSDGENIITVKLPYKEKLSSMENTVLAVGLAVITYGGLSLLPDADTAAIAKNYFDPITNLIIGVIKMLAMVMIFTSMVNVISGIGDKDKFTRYGRKTFLKIQADNFAATFIGLIGTAMFFGVLKADTSFDSSIILQVFNILIDIIPTNIIEPFARGSGLEILFMGICLGCLLLPLQSEAGTVIRFFREMDLVVNRLLTIVCRRIYYLVYFSVVCLLVSGITDKLSVIANVLIAQLIFSYGFLAANLIFVSLSSGVGISTMLKVLSHVFIVGASSGAAITMVDPIKEAFTGKLKVKKQVLDFVLPIELIMDKPDMALSIIIWSILSLTVYGIQISLGQMLVAGLMTAILASAIPPVPGGLFVVQSIIYQELGIPIEAMAIAIATDPIFRIVRTGLRGVLFGSNIIYLDHKLEEKND